MSRVLAVLGGGSAYAPGLVQALLHHAKSLELSEVRLHDLDQERLEVVGTLADRMSTAVGRPFAVVPMASLDDALRGARVVLNSTRPGGLRARHLDETIPLEFDVPGQETVGPGGFFFALRSVPYALKLAARMRELAPSATLLNYTNPTNIVCQALADRTDLRFLGLCDQSDEDLETLARAAGRPGTFSFECVGLNHATWYARLVASDGTVFNPSRALEPPADLDEEHRLRFVLSRELWTRVRSGWPNSYLPYYTHPADFVALTRRRGSRAEIIEASLPSYYQHFREEGAKEVPHLLRHRGTSGFGDLAVRTLIALGRPERQRLVLNVPGGGCTATFRPDTVVEVPVELGASSLVRHSPAPPPSFLEPLLHRLERYQRAAAEVASKPSTAAELADALAENPLVADRKIAGKLIERARQAYAPGLLELRS